MSEISLNISADELKRRIVLSDRWGNKATSLRRFNAVGVLTALIFLLLTLLDGAPEDLFLAVSHFISMFVILSSAYGMYLSHRAIRILVTGQ